MENVRNRDSGYDTVIEADKLEKFLGLSQHDHKDHDHKARCGVVGGPVMTGMGKIISPPVSCRRVDLLTWG